MATSVLPVEVFGKSPGTLPAPVELPISVKSLAPAESPAPTDLLASDELLAPASSPVLGRAPLPNESPLHDLVPFHLAVSSLSASEGHDGASQTLYGGRWQSSSPPFPYALLGMSAT